MKTRNIRTNDSVGGRSGRGPGASAVGRPVGAEFRAVAWLVRHPDLTAVPILLGAGVIRLGPITTASSVFGLLLGLLVWGRVHPPSFDRWAAPRLRTWWRRWTVYRGRRWARVLEACELTRTRPRSEHLLVPRVGRFRSVTASIDTLRVRMVPGQDVKVWTEHLLPALADTLGVHQVAVTRHHPGVLALVIERWMPFTYVVEATTIPPDAAAVDLGRIRLGDNEYGQPFTIRLRGKHFLGVGATGAGKSGLLWNVLLAVAPLIRDGLARVWMIDLKGGTETQFAEPMFYRWATNGEQAIGLLTEYRDAMLERQADMRAHRLRKNTITRETPWELLIVDELAMLTAYGDRQVVREALRLLAEVMTQGRAADFSVAAYVQEPSKDVVDVRDLFTTRVCLGVTAAVHVDMALGDGARDKGALADEIPGDDAHAGIGFAIAPGSRLPIRLRAGLVTDRDITDLVTYVTTPTDADGDNAGDDIASDDAEVVPLRKQTHRTSRAGRTGREDVS